MLCFYASKGGVGCSVVTAASALLSSSDRDTLLVDLKGDQPDILGLPGDGPGLGEWFAAEAALPDTLARLEMRVSPTLALLPLGTRDGNTSVSATNWTLERATMLTSLLESDGRRIVVDVGVPTTPAARSILALADRTILVLRSCYLAVRAADVMPTADHIVLLDEPGRALRKDDIAAALDHPIDVSLSTDISVARGVDAGLLAARLPKSLLGLRTLL